MTRTFLPAALALATLGGAVQAQTSPQPVGYQYAMANQTVRFGDLDTSTNTGADRLAFRIKVAARAVCGGDDPVVRSGGGFDGCVQTAMQQAATRVDNPMVTAALHLSPVSSAYARR